MSLPALATATSAHRAANCANATSPQRSAHRIPYNDHAAHRANATSQQRSAHRIPYNDCAAHRANATSPQRSAHRIPYNDRAAHRANATSPQRSAHRPPHTGNQTSAVVISVSIVVISVSKISNIKLGILFVLISFIFDVQILNNIVNLL